MSDPFDNPYTYICELGHVDAAPVFGTYGSCQCPVRVVSRRGGVGTAPCGRGVVRVPADPVLEATYRVGGGEAVLAVVRERIAPPTG